MTCNNMTTLTYLELVMTIVNILLSVSYIYVLLIIGIYIILLYIYWRYFKFGR